MAGTDNNVSGEARQTDGDQLSETALNAVDKRANASDYVERGCGFSVDHGANTVDIGSTGTRANFAIVTNDTSQLAWKLFPDQATGLSLQTTSGTNHVFIAYDEANDQIYYHIDDDDSAPSDPSLKIGTIDASADTDTETNREPTITVEDLDIESLSEGAAKILIEGYTDSDDGGGRTWTQQTDGVSTSATTILDGDVSWTAGEMGGALVVVTGDKRADTKRFVELVLYGTGINASPNVISTTTQGTPDGRTYTQSARDLQLAMAANTYDVVVYAIGTRRDANATS